MAQDGIPGGRDPDHAEGREAERREMLARLVQRRSKLTEPEVAQLREVFPLIFAAHHDQIWNQLRRRGLERYEIEDLTQECLITLHNHIIGEGFPDSIAKWLHRTTELIFLGHLRARRRSPLSLGLPSSSEEPPLSPAAASELSEREVARRLLPRLSPEHREVVEAVTIGDLTHGEAAALLGIPLGTLKARLIAAKTALHRMAVLILPPSQRGPR